MDVLETYITQAIATMKTNVLLTDETTQRGKPWMGIRVAFASVLPAVLDQEERKDIAFKNMRRALNEIFGVDKWGTERRPKKDGSGKDVMWIIIKKK